VREKRFKDRNLSDDVFIEKKVLVYLTTIDLPMRKSKLESAHPNDAISNHLNSAFNQKRPTFE